MKTMDFTDAKGIRHEVSYGEITVASLYVSSFQKEGTKTAELHQKVTDRAFYPTKKVTSDKQDNLFAISDFGFAENDFETTQNRTVFMDVPENKTIEEVEAQLKKFPDAHLYRVISNAPIITDNQKSAIERGQTSLDIIALGRNGDKGQILRYGADSEDGKHLKGDLILNNGTIQYRQYYFTTDATKEDIDLRTEDITKHYIPASLKAAISGVIPEAAGQRIF